MRIRQIRAMGLRGATPPGGWSRELVEDDVVHTLVVVETDEGVEGVGSVFTSEQLVQASLAFLEPLYQGEDALEPERVSESLHQHTFWQGRGGAVTHTISGIDIALWDILGKVLGRSIGRLVGGRYRERIRPYASILMEDSPAMSELLLELKQQGFRAFKIGWGPFGRADAATDERVVRAAREAIGAECQLMVDAGGSDAHWQGDYKWALRASDMLAAYDVAWFEEPLRPDALEDHAALRERARVPIAGGEVLTRRQSFTPYLVGRAFDIVQPDVTKVGGISEQRRIAWLAEATGARMIPHGWNTAVGLAADLQLGAALPDSDLVEYKPGSRYIDDLTVTPWRLDADGFLPIPDGPGLGIELDPERLAAYTTPRGHTVGP